MWEWLRFRRQRIKSWILVWNVLLRFLMPVESFRTPVTFQQKQGSHNKESKFYKKNHMNGESWPPRFIYRSSPAPPLPQLYHPHNFVPTTRPHVAPLKTALFQRPSVSPNTFIHRKWNRPYDLKKKQSCDGRSNILQDLGVLAIATGAVGTLLSIFTASYFSIVGNVISIISGILSYATGIPSAIITYLAASDRISYTVANVLSLLSLANTAYGFWSVDFGNKDIITSQVANTIGLFSLLLSLVTAFPEIFDAFIYEISKHNMNKRRRIDRFIRNYGCSGGKTYYERAQQFLNYLSTL